MKIKETIGIDISKSTVDAHVLSSKAISEFDNTDKELKKMIKWAYSNSKFDKNEILFVFENTGIYSDRLAYLLSDKNIPFLIVPGLEIKKSLGTTRGKDDKIDAARIALYAYRRRDELKPSKLPHNVIRTIRQLLSLRERLVKQRAGFKANVKEIKHAIPKLHAKSIVTCQNSMIKVLSTQIKKIDSELNDVCSKDEKMDNMFNLMISIKGIGPQTALNLIAYTAGFTKFDNWRQFASYCGIAPFPNRSGTSIRGANKISHLANKKLKSLLDLCAKSAIQNSYEMKTYYDKRVSEGKNKRSTINIIRNKLLSRAFAVIKRNTPYVDVLKFAA